MKGGSKEDPQLGDPVGSCEDCDVERWAVARGYQDPRETADYQQHTTVRRAQASNEQIKRRRESPQRLARYTQAQDDREAREYNEALDRMGIGHNRRRGLAAAARRRR